MADLLPAGIHYWPPVSPTPPHAVRVSIAGDWTEAAGLVLFGCESSVDGGATWRHAVSSVAYGGAVDRRGQPSSVMLTTPEPGAQYRPFLLLSRSARLALQIEMR